MLMPLRRNEYYSPAQSRWIHLDSCECSRDEPHIYDRGWAKKMSYVIAFSVDGAVDVSRRYIYPGGPGGPDAREKGGREGESWEELRAERRRRISEEVLEQVCCPSLRGDGVTELRCTDSQGGHGASEGRKAPGRPHAA